MKPPTVFLLLTPGYASVGDQAIAWAEERWLAARYPGCRLCVLEEQQTLARLPALLADASPEDRFYLQGGGNLGSLYPAVEERRRQVLQALGDRPAVLFPQSAWFSGDEEARRSAAFYSRPGLTLFAREKGSFDLMRRWYPRAEVLLRPDIVCSLAPAAHRLPARRTRVLVSLRADRESAFPRRREALLQGLRRVWPDLEEYRMYRGPVFEASRRPALMDETLRLFRSTRLIITDRLHGILLVAVTGTPCVALPNAYHKNRDCCAWLAGVNFIAFCPDPTLPAILQLAGAVTAIPGREKSSLPKTGWEYDDPSDPSEHDPQPGLGTAAPAQPPLLSGGPL